MKIVTGAYLVIQPERRGHDGKVVGIAIDRIVKTKPTRLGVRDIAIKIVLRVDDRLFTVPEPEVTIDLDDHRALIVPKIDVDGQPECPVGCGSDERCELRSDWREWVAEGSSIAIVGCGNPWHYLRDGRPFDEDEAALEAAVATGQKVPEVTT